MAMLVIGIDPGLSRCGYGVVTDSGANIGRSGSELLSAGLIETSPQSPLGERLKLFLEDISELIAYYRPEVVALERILFRKNAKTAFGVSQAVGLVHLAAFAANVTVVEYSAAEVKLAVTGHGAASKYQVQRMVQLLGDLPEMPRPPDVADAVALAYCHVASARGGRIGSSIG